MNKCVPFLILAVLSGAWMWTTGDRVVRAQENPPVRMIPAGQRQAAARGEKGATYYGLEAQTSKLTTRFHDGRLAVSQRGLIGDIQTTLHDPNGNEEALLRITLVDSTGDIVRFESKGHESFQAMSTPESAKHTLDWASAQAYTFAKDGVADLIWDNGMMRSKLHPRRDVDREIDEIESVWGNGVVVKLTKHDLPPRELAKGRIVNGPAWVAELTVNGAPSGRSWWFERDQVLAYYLPAVMDRLVWVGPEHLKSQYGGWPFKTDPTWLNVQTIAAYHFATQSPKQSSVAKACEAPRPNRIVQFFFPTVLANEPGCDGLHWLDGGILRQCCDDHDRCYARDGCTSQSWWQVWTSWTCNFCNMAVVVCFYTGSMYEPCLARSWYSC